MSGSCFRSWCCFLKKFDTEWQRYNRDLIRRLQEENQ